MTLNIEKKIFHQYFRLDAFYLLNTLIKTLSKKGKLSKAKKIINQVAYLIKIEHKNFSFLFFYQAISYIRPLLGFKSQSNLTKINLKSQIIPLSLKKSYQLALR
jgi:pentatricopeptide repeat protein